MTWRSLWLYSGTFTLFVAAYQVLGNEPSRPAELLLSYGPPAAVAVCAVAAGDAALDRVPGAGRVIMATAAPMQRA